MSLRNHRPIGFPPQVWLALLAVRQAQARLEDDLPRYNPAGQKFAIESATASLRDAHAQLMHFVEEVQKATA